MTSRKENLEGSSSPYCLTNDELSTEEMSILGYGDLGFACNCYPRLSTIRQPQAELGVCAVRMACRMIRGEPVTEPVLLPSELVLRESAGPRMK